MVSSPKHLLQVNQVYIPDPAAASDNLSHLGQLGRLKILNSLRRHQLCDEFCQIISHPSPTS